MRKIKFRGRVAVRTWVQASKISSGWVKPGTWVYGYYIERKDDHDTSHKIYDPDTGTWYKVIPETVGQYTGLKDKNSKESYKGDVLKSSSRVRNVRTGKETGEISTTTKEIIYLEEEGRFATKYLTDSRKLHEKGYLNPLTLRQKIIGEYCEIIGNIYEHGHLLK